MSLYVDVSSPFTSLLTEKVSSVKINESFTPPKTVKKCLYEPYEPFQPEEEGFLKARPTPTPPTSPSRPPLQHGTERPNHLGILLF